MEPQDVVAARRVRQRDLDLHVEAARAQRRRVHEVQAIRRADDQDVALLAHAVELRQELVHDAVARRAPEGPVARLAAAALAHDGVALVEHDDVQRRRAAEALPLVVRGLEEAAHGLLRRAEQVAEDLGPLDDDGLPVAQDFGEAARDQRLARARRAVQQQAARVAQAQALARLRGHHARHEHAPQHAAELLAEAADAERGAEVLGGVDDGPPLLLGDARARRLLRGQREAAPRRAREGVCELAEKHRRVCALQATASGYVTRRLAAAVCALQVDCVGGGAAM